MDALRSSLRTSRRRRGARSAGALFILLAVGVGLVAGAGPAGAETPPSGTYRGTFGSGTAVTATIDCTASACTISKLGTFEIGTLARVGEGHYQGTGPYPPELLRGTRACPGSGDAQLHADLAIADGQAIVTLAIDGFSITCNGGRNTSRAEPFTISATLASTAPTTTTSTTSTTSTTTTSTTVAATVPTTQPPLAAKLSARQRASLAAVRRGQRSSVTAALASPSESLDRDRIVTSGLLAGALVLLMVFPSELFNATYERHHDRVERAVTRLPWWPGRRAPVPERTRLARTVRYGAVLVAGAVIAGFLDPGFGIDQASLTFVLGVVLASLTGTTVSTLTARTYRRTRHLSTEAVLDAVPSGLVVAAVGVAISRLVHFQPGYLYGLVGGVAFAAALDADDAGRSQFTSFAVTLVAAGLAWFAFVPVSEAANRPGPSVGITLLDAVLGALFIAGVEGTLFGLVPLTNLPGRKLARWSWWAWGAVAAVASFLFVDVLLRPASGYLGRSTTASAVVVYGLFAAFGLGSVLFWGWFRLRPDDPHPPEQPEQAELAEPGTNPAAGSS